MFLSLSRASSFWPFSLASSASTTFVRFVADRSSSRLFRVSLSHFAPFASTSSTIAAAMSADADCLFCKIIKGDIPSFKLMETDHSYAFLDIGPLSRGHALVISKQHAAKMHELSDESLADILPVVKKVAIASGAVDYNVLQNNGKLAHQEVMHVHFHMIPKPDAEQGLGVKWPTKPADMDELKKLCEEIKGKM